jgi:hypothetical protein
MRRLHVPVHVLGLAKAGKWYTCQLLQVYYSCTMLHGSTYIWYSSVHRGTAVDIYCSIRRVGGSVWLRGSLRLFLSNIQGITSELQYYYHAVQHVSQAPPTGRAKMPSRSPCPTAAEARGRRPGAGRRRAWGSWGHFGGRCCLTAGATTDHSPDASRLCHPGTSLEAQV